MPAAYAMLGSGLGNANTALFGSFAAFAALALADFGGRLPQRFLAYLGLAFGGAGLVVVGTLVSRSLLAATLVMAVVAFGIVMLGALGGYWTAGATAAILAYVLAATIQAPAAEISFVVAFVLWPRGAEGAVGTAFVELLDADTALVRDELALVDPSRSDVRGARDRAADALAARHRAIVALDGLATERGGSIAQQQPWATRFAVAAERTAAGIARGTVRGDPDRSRALRRAIAAEGDRIVDELHDVAMLARRPAQARNLTMIADG
jgi:hypothetical protein